MDNCQGCIIRELNSLRSLNDDELLKINILKTKKQLILLEMVGVNFCTSNPI